MVKKSVCIEKKLGNTKTFATLGQAVGDFLPYVCCYKVFAKNKNFNKKKNGQRTRISGSPEKDIQMANKHMMLNIISHQGNVNQNQEIPPHIHQHGYSKKK